LLLHLIIITTTTTTKIIIIIIIVSLQLRLTSRDTASPRLPLGPPSPRS
jgi:hypothetical protein